MRWVTYSHKGELAERTGLVVDNEIYGLEPGTRLIDLLGDLNTAGQRARTAPAERVALDAVKLRSPITNPPTIRDFSSFYEHHSAGIKAVGQKFDDAWYELPFFYFSITTSMLGDGDTFIKPHNSKNMDYELEVCCVIGRECKDVSVEDAEKYIAGYAIFNDWSARDLQRDEMARAPVGPAKGKDSGNSMGPYLVTPDELEDRRKNNGYDLRMTAKVNGKLYSAANWSTVYWSMAEHVSYASRNTKLVPGDILCTGTVGTGCILELSATHGSEKFPWLQPGDELTLEVERLGVMRSKIAEGGEVWPIRGRINGSRVEKK